MVEATFSSSLNMEFFVDKMHFPVEGNEWLNIVYVLTSHLPVINRKEALNFPCSEEAIM